jgi:hypothetical protein
MQQENRQYLTRSGNSIHSDTGRGPERSIAVPDLKAFRGAWQLCRRNGGEKGQELPCNIDNERSVYNEQNNPQPRRHAFSDREQLRCKCTNDFTAWGEMFMYSGSRLYLQLCS